MRLIPTIAAFCTAASMTVASPEFWASEWPNTDFENTSVNNWVEVMSGGPPKDGIPALDAPSFMAVADKPNLMPREPVITLEIAGETPRAYPIRYLTWHEIVNDVVGDVPVAVTFCPLCNSGITFDRRIAQGTLSFGVSGKLRNSDMIMYDRETESWWQQAIGEAIVGDLNGTELVSLPSWMESWEVFATRNPDGLVMAQPNFNRNYGANPYVRYDSSNRPFLYSGEMPPHDIPALARVVRVGEQAWPLTRLAEAGELTEAGVTFSWTQGQASALDSARIGEGKEVGNVRVRDASGADIAHDVMFAFAFDAFWPEGEWMIGK
jgi:hypothetical protein